MLSTYEPKNSKLNKYPCNSTEKAFLSTTNSLLLHVPIQKDRSLKPWSKNCLCKLAKKTLRLNQQIYSQQKQKNNKSTHKAPERKRKMPTQSLATFNPRLKLAPHDIIISQGSEDETSARRTGCIKKLKTYSKGYQHNMSTPTRIQPSRDSKRRRVDEDEQDQVMAPQGNDQAIATPAPDLTPIQDPPTATLPRQEPVRQQPPKWIPQPPPAWHLLSEQAFKTSNPDTSMASTSRIQQASEDANFLREAAKATEDPLVQLCLQSQEDDIPETKRSQFLLQITSRP